MLSRACISTFGQPSQEDRCRRAANALAGLILLRYGEDERGFTDGAEACDDANARERPSDEPAGCGGARLSPSSWPSGAAKRDSPRSLCARSLPCRLPFPRGSRRSPHRVVARIGPAPRSKLVWRNFLPDILEFATRWISLPHERQNRPPPLPGDSRLRCWLCPSLIQRPK